MNHIKGFSLDTAGRIPIMAPWSIYPFPPEDCAALICDLLIFETTVSGQALVTSLEKAGVHGELLLTPVDVQLGDDMPVIRARSGKRVLTWNAHSLGLVLYELAEPETLARGTREVLMMNNVPAEPVLAYADEALTWLPAVS